MRIAVIILFLLALPCLMSYLAADEVYLTDGRVLVGEVISDPADGKLKFKVIVGSMTMVMDIARRDIVQIKKGKTDEEKALAEIQAQRQSLASGHDQADKLWDLALQLQNMKHSILFKEYARAVLDLSPQHAAANQAIGNVQHEGVWMTSREMHLARGEVFFESQWMSTEARDQIISEREVARIALAERRAERAEERADERAERSRLQTFSSINYPTIDYGGIRLYHCSPLIQGLPSSGYRYGSSSSSSSSGFSFQASGNQSWGSWNMSWKN